MHNFEIIGSGQYLCLIRLFTEVLVFIYFLLIYFSQRFGVDMIFYDLSLSPKLHLFDEKYNKNSNIVKYYCHLK